MTMQHTPLKRQRSPWVEVEAVIPWGKQYERRTNDGLLVALVADEPTIGWHLSISFRNHRGDLSRYPTWDEIAHARLELLPKNVGFVMHLPPVEEYVALHDTTFHLHQHPEPPRQHPGSIADMILTPEEQTKLYDDLAAIADNQRRAAAASSQIVLY